MPANAKSKKFNQQLVLRYGEKSGHVHEVVPEDLSKIELYTMDELLFLVAKEEIKIVHNKGEKPTNEHKPVILPPGIHQVGDIVEERYSLGDSKVQYYKPAPVVD